MEAPCPLRFLFLHLRNLKDAACLYFGDFAVKSYLSFTDQPSLPPCYSELQIMLHLKLHFYITLQYIMGCIFEGSSSCCVGAVL